MASTQSWWLCGVDVVVGGAKEGWWRLVGNVEDRWCGWRDVVEDWCDGLGYWMFYLF